MIAFTLGYKSTYRKAPGSPMPFNLLGWLMIVEEKNLQLMAAGVGAKKKRQRD